MPRHSVLLMSAGAGALLLALGLLWQSTQSEPVSATPTVSPRQPAAPATPAAPPAPRARRVTPAMPNAPATTRAIHSERAPSMPAPAPALEPEKLPPAVRSDHNLQFGAPQLRAQTKAVEPLVRSCIEKARTLPTGTAYFTYVVTKREDKFVIEETGVEPSGTTIEDEDLLTCLHQTANAMKFIGLPRDAESILATRMVAIDHGKLTEYKHVTFSYLK